MIFDYLHRVIFPCASLFWPWATGLMANTTMLLAGVLAFSALIGARRAPLRHLVASLALASLALLPLLCLLVAWQRGLLVGLSAPWTAPPVDSPVGTFRPGLARALVATWALGAAWMLVRLVVDLTVLWWHAGRRAAPVAGPVSRMARRLAARIGIRRPVRVLRSDAFDIPYTWGFLRPVVLLPRGAPAWDDERLQAVLLHELGHIRRWDGLFTALSRLACALYWFHPLAWWLERRAREDAERACDRLVIEQGVAPERYARHLLGIIRDTQRTVSSVVPSMAGDTHVGRRIADLLEHRFAMSSARRGAVLTAAVSLVALTAMLVSVSLPAVPVGGPVPPAPNCGGDAPPPESYPETLPDDLQSSPAEPAPFTGSL